MKISISSLYFNPLNLADIECLSSLGLNAVELVIYHQFGTYVPCKKMLDFKAILNKNNIEVSGIQGFTFKPETDLKKEFLEFTKTWIEHLDNLILSALLFKTNKLIFGAPSFRLNLKDKENFVSSFIKTSKYLKLNGIDILLEAVPEIYGSKFFSTINSVLNFNNVNGLLNHFDTGCYLNESTKASFCSPIINSKINHLHISSTNLGFISKNHVLMNWIKKFGLPKSYDNYIVLESTLKLQNVRDAECDINYLKKIITNGS